MIPRKRVLLLIAIMIAVSLVVELTTFSLLYRAAFREEEARLVETAKSQARLLEAIARHHQRAPADHPEDVAAATLEQVTDAHSHYGGFGRTGEFTLSREEDGEIVFLLAHRHGDLGVPRAISADSSLAVPMRRALAGVSGTVVGSDYRGVPVLAAHEPVAGLDWGIVAKIDLSEIREPFIRAGLISGLFGLAAIVLGARLFLKITDPLLTRLEATIKSLREALSNVRQLSGLLPICASCKNIRDDKGYWKQIEAYIRDHSDADFSHSICPECMDKLYGDLVEEDAAGGSGDGAETSPPG